MLVCDFNETWHDDSFGAQTDHCGILETYEKWLNNIFFSKTLTRPSTISLTWP